MNINVSSHLLCKLIVHSLESELKGAKLESIGSNLSGRNNGELLPTIVEDTG